MVRGVTYVLLQPVRIHTLMFHSFHSSYFVIKKGTKVSVKQSSKIGLNFWLIPGNLSVVWWLCSFHASRLFRQKKLKCKILAISIAIERDAIKMCFKHYYFMIRLLFFHHIFIFKNVKFHVSLYLHLTDSPGKLLQERYCLHLGVFREGLYWKD